MRKKVKYTMHISRQLEIDEEDIESRAVFWRKYPMNYVNYYDGSEPEHEVTYTVLED
jgi:hypothetical protein